MKALLKLSIGIIAFIYIFGSMARSCNKPEPSYSTADDFTYTTPVSGKATLESKTPKYYIAQCVIAKLMSQSVSAITAMDKGEYFLVHYISNVDKVRYDYKVKFLEGNMVAWAVHPDGRWRTLPEDGTIAWEEEGDNIRIIETFSDGSKSDEVFPI